LLGNFKTCIKGHQPTFFGLEKRKQETKTILKNKETNTFGEKKKNFEFKRKSIFFLTREKLIYCFVKEKLRLMIFGVVFD